MANKESTYLNMVITLVVITLIASSALGFVYEWTKGPIAEAKLAKKIKSIKAVVPEYSNEPLEDMKLVPLPGTHDSLEVYQAKKDDNIVGDAIRSYSAKGYSGNVWIMVGFLPDGTIKNIFVLDHKETPGLGANMSKESFIEQFRGKDPTSFNLKVRKDGGDVDALTGATISSRAFTEAVQKAYDVFKEGGKND